MDNLKQILKALLEVGLSLGILVKNLALLVREILKGLWALLVFIYLFLRNKDMSAKKKGAIIVTFIGAISFLSFFVFSQKGKREIAKVSQKIKLDTNSDKIFGVDLSHYQGDIDWESFSSQEKHPIQYVFVRATMGANRKDKKFQKNFSEAKRRGFVVGVYHYYDPNENSTLQAQNFIESVKLEKGDFRPVLDIEVYPKVQSMEKMKKGLKNWLTIIEKEYGVKPVIYTGLSFWKDNLQKDFADYPLWIAAYSPSKRNDPTVKKAEMHQFTDKVRIAGIKGYVDGNDIPKSKFDSLLIK